MQTEVLKCETQCMQLAQPKILFTNSKHIGEDDMPDLGLAYVRVIVQETWGQNTMNGPYY